MNKGLRFSVAVLLLSGCSAPPFDSAQGGLRQDGALLRSAPPAGSQVRATNVARFHYTGAQQTFTVPSGVTQITVTADGASGAGSTFRHMKGGKGGLVKATIPVASGETLAIFVGGDGGKSSASGGPGGFNGGGNGGVTGSGSASERQRRRRRAPTCAKAEPVWLIASWLRGAAAAPAVLRVRSRSRRSGRWSDRRTRRVSPRRRWPEWFRRKGWLANVGREGWTQRSSRGVPGFRPR